MPIVNLEQLCELKRQGYVVIVPQQGLNPVPDGLAHVAKIELSQNPDAHFFQLSFNGTSQIFIMTERESIEFAREWIEENIDRSNYRLQLEYSCYNVDFNDQNNHASILGTPHHVRLDFASRVIKNLGGKITFDANQHTAPIKIEYETKSKSKERLEQLVEINLFESTIKRLLAAASYVTEFGFALVYRDIIEPTTMWIARDATRPLKFEEGLTELVFNKMEQKCRETDAVKALAEMNSITSHRAQVIYGYEAIISLLNEEINNCLKGEIQLPKKKSRRFKSELAIWIKMWMDDNQVDYDEEYLGKLELNTNAILNKGASPSNKESTLNVLAAYLAQGDPDIDNLELLYEMRNAFAHNRRDKYSSEELKTSIRILRKIMQRIAKV